MKHVSKEYISDRIENTSEYKRVENFIDKLKYDKNVREPIEDQKLEIEKQKQLKTKVSTRKQFQEPDPVESPKDEYDSSFWRCLDVCVN